MNIVDPILYQCRQNPFVSAICVPGSSIGTVKYGQLKELIVNSADAARKAGISPGAIVAISVADTTLHALLMLGLTLLGAVTISLQESEVPNGISVDAILTDVVGRFSEKEKVITVDDAWLAGDAVWVEQEVAGREDARCRIALSSDRVGRSKAIALSHKNLAARLSSSIYANGPHFAHGARFFCHHGIGTAPGFWYLMSLLSRGGTIFFLGRDPIDLLQAIDLHKVQGMGASPQGLSKFLDIFDADRTFPVSFDYIVCDGAVLPREISQRARARMTPNLYRFYGPAETSAVAFGPASIADSIPGAVGYVLPGTTVEIVDPSGEVLPATQLGLLRIRGPQMVCGYIGEADVSDTCFRSGYFYPGDAGFMTPDGVLVVTRSAGGT